MKIHELKLDIKYFDDVKNGIKNFEIRKNDRDFQVGDILELKKVSWFLKFLVPIRYAISIMTNRRQTYLDKDDIPCIESKADTIKAKILNVVPADEYNNFHESVNGIPQSIKWANSCQETYIKTINKVLNDYFSADRLPDSYVILGIEVIK
ncbi:DUF3850 domain-containing protein [Lactococcus allomyrinae]|uniref:DUF3850 domain-containing protein n=1 Tax=Lactococcus allomyrinae TaxID=2419773 RepID=A0A387BBT1_9LACT|nr:DUF3850 domain-containing protein [Lactococcus allomyrinae]AYF99887.1 DUF3850 domain-containing protein [Lactococcus allomyrinae]